MTEHLDDNRESQFPPTLKVSSNSKIHYSILMQCKQLLSASTLIRDSYIDIQGIDAYGWILRDSVAPPRICPQGNSDYSTLDIEISLFFPVPSLQKFLKEMR